MIGVGAAIEDYNKLRKEHKNILSDLVQDK
jgi:hypothetical protein